MIDQRIFPSHDSTTVVDETINSYFFISSEFDLSERDVEQLRNLKVPLNNDEGDRIVVLRQTQLLDSDFSEVEYDRYTTMGARIFQVTARNHELCVFSSCLIVDTVSHRLCYKISGF